MDAILQGLPQVICYLDDILITDSTAEEHSKNLAEVLDRLADHGLKLKQEKCSFLQDSVKYLGTTLMLKEFTPHLAKLRLSLKHQLQRMLLSFAHF